MIVKDVIPLYWFSTSSNIGDKGNSTICFQQTESCTLKTLHNSFQRKTTVMDYRLLRKGGRSLVNTWCWSTIHSGQVQAFFLSFSFHFSFCSYVSSSPPPFSTLLLSSLSSSSSLLNSLLLFLSFFVPFFLPSSSPFPLYSSPFPTSVLITTIAFNFQMKVINARLTEILDFWMCS